MKKLMIVALGCALASGAIAKEAAFQLSLVPNVAIQDRDTDITGVSIGIWNENPSPKFQWQLIGLINGATGDSVGVQWSFFLPGLFGYAENYTGAQLNMINWASGDFVGAQLGLFNGAGSITGLQWGMVNYTKDIKAGLQLGMVNWAKHSTQGVQVGFVNIIPENKWFKDGDLAQGMIIVNWGF